MDSIKKFEVDNHHKIHRLLSSFFVFVDENDELAEKGLVLCHGHNHSMEELFKVQKIKYWYMVDYSKKCYPDYVANVADVSSDGDMAYFPDNSFDCVMTIYCPIYRSDSNEYQYVDVLKNMHRIVKKNGFICLTELPGLFFYFVDDETVSLIANKINKILGEKDVHCHRNKYIKEEMLANEPSDREIYCDIILYYHGPIEIPPIQASSPRFLNADLKKKTLQKFIDKISLKYSIEFLAKNNFEFVEINKGILTARPMNK